MGKYQGVYVGAVVEAEGGSGGFYGGDVFVPEVGVFGFYVVEAYEDGVDYGFYFDWEFFDDHLKEVEYCVCDVCFFYILLC